MSSINENVETIEHQQIHNSNVELSTWISDHSKRNLQLNVGSDKFHQLIENLSESHSELDDYVQKRTKLISDETQKIIEKILEETKEKQRILLIETQMKSENLHEQYQKDLEEKVHQLNEEKAEKLVQLEKCLNDEQEMIIDKAKQQIDLLQRRANQMKMNLILEAQQRTNEHIEHITDQVVLIGQEDAAQRLASKSTTVITTQSIAQNIDSI